MIRKVLSIVSLVISGFFLYILLIVSFAPMPSFNIKLAVMGIYLIPTLLALFMGLALRSFAQSQRVCGILILSTAAFCAFVILSVVCVLAAPEFRSLVGPEAFALFADVSSGVIFFSLVLFLGAVLFYRGKTA
jgi:hypothetical protein